LQLKCINYLTGDGLANWDWSAFKCSFRFCWNIRQNQNQLTKFLVKN